MVLIKLTKNSNARIVADNSQKGALASPVGIDFLKKLPGTLFSILFLYQQEQQDSLLKKQ